MTPATPSPMTAPALSESLEAAYRRTRNMVLGMLAIPLLLPLAAITVLAIHPPTFHLRLARPDSVYFGIAFAFMVLSLIVRRTLTSYSRLADCSTDERLAVAFERAHRLEAIIGVLPGLVGIVYVALERPTAEVVVPILDRPIEPHLAAVLPFLVISLGAVLLALPIRGHLEDLAERYLDRP